VYKFRSVELAVPREVRDDSRTVALDDELRGLSAGFQCFSMDARRHFHRKDRRVGFRDIRVGAVEEGCRTGVEGSGISKVRLPRDHPCSPYLNGADTAAVELYENNMVFDSGRILRN
jgi:hypothetical protein